jgi:HEPN domain-containing protein
LDKAKEDLADAEEKFKNGEISEAAYESWKNNVKELEE